MWPCGGSEPIPVVEGSMYKYSYIYMVISGRYGINCEHRVCPPLQLNVYTYKRTYIALPFDELLPHRQVESYDILSL